MNYNHAGKLQQTQRQRPFFHRFQSELQRSLIVGLILMAFMPFTTPCQEKNIQNSGSEYPFVACDAVAVSVYPDTASFLNGIYPIDENGIVDLPIIGMMRIVDLSIQEAEKRLRSHYVNYLAQPNIHVRPMIRASALGGFAMPGLYYIEPRNSLWTLIRMAGGPQREDGLKKLRWERNQTVILSDCIPYLESGQSLASMGFKSGDQIRVTQSPKRGGWDIFLNDYVPLLTFIVSTVSTSVTTYVLIQSLSNSNTNRGN
ncbi:MAG: polysaccharide biosynthesis/export family protein [Chitinivibrionales bacterium]|nr:polysaccharide biosynthesis/export family protein [Chitinivibrionales bacterium]